MRERYELWDVNAGNMIGVYVTLAAALAEVRGLLEANGTAYAADLSLARRDHDAGEHVAESEALARLAGAG